MKKFFAFVMAVTMVIGVLALGPAEALAKENTQAENAVSALGEWNEVEEAFSAAVRAEGGAVIAMHHWIDIEDNVIWWYVKVYDYETMQYEEGTFYVYTDDVHALNVELRTYNTMSKVF